MHCFLNAMKQPPDGDGVRNSRYIVIRSSYPALRSTVIKTWKHWFKDLLRVVYRTPIYGEIDLQHPDGETSIHMELEFIALDRDEEVEKLQSLEAVGAHINEAAGVPASVFQMLKSRIGRFISGRDVDPFIILDYNATDTDHWLYKLTEQSPERHQFFSQPPAMFMCAGPYEGGVVQDIKGNWYRLNPAADNLANLRKNYYEDQVAGANPDWINVFILNNWGMVRSGRPVYTEYVDNIHCAEEPLVPLAGVPMVIGMDLGMTPAAAFMQMTPTGTVIMFDELVTEDCSIKKFCAEYLWPTIRNKYSNLDFVLVVDPAATQRSQNDAVMAANIIEQAGLPFRAASTNNPLARREAVVGFLRRINGFKISPTCKFARKGFISHYRFEQKRSVQSVAYKDKPEKNMWSHIHDAIQYACLELEEHNTSSGASIMNRPRRRYQPASTVAGY